MRGHPSGRAGEVLNGREHHEQSSFRSASLAFKAAADRLDVTGPAAADYLSSRQRVGGGAARALHAQRAAEADEIGGRADVLVEHSRAVACGEQKGSIANITESSDAKVVLSYNQSAVA